MSDDDANDWNDYSSGPFCKHWGDPSDCDRKCARCGDACYAHWDGEKCRHCDGCDAFCEEGETDVNAA